MSHQIEYVHIVLLISSIKRDTKTEKGLLDDVNTMTIVERRDNVSTVQRTDAKKRHVFTVQRTEVKETEMNSRIVTCDSGHVPLSKRNIYLLFSNNVKIMKASKDIYEYGLKQI